ncbi:MULTISPECIES: alpha/beta hydrolase [unclassified Amycolatopsis]|uniref:alpha/beta fold hydrolase n=1 Tax=unclassified Amycolatopsis TaxID=2618356 RepID=UPI0028759C14|nr:MULTISPECIES: alpha/beta hydrolase [unclassified Amycolatopsis]MDS0134821.1 alpha/beta hydrolase [Amycolatopsis sp. 505]MDS0148003.1 alpha/beta hydrolase [Amycolatopsis sp. CM201R]
MATIEVGGTAFGYDEAGEGPAVVLLHAAIGDRRMWDAQFTELAATHRVIRYDRRGFGETRGEAGEHAHYEDLLALLDARGIEQAALVGASMGGACALDAALAAPERITRLVLLGSGLTGHTWPDHMQADLARLTEELFPGDRLARYQARDADVDPADVRAMAEANIRYMVAGPGRDISVLPPEMVALVREMCEQVYRHDWTAPQWTERIPDTRHRLAEITTPALVVIGTSDAPGLVELSAHLAESLPRAELAELADTGHLPSMERPDEVNALLRKFL